MTQRERVLTMSEWFSLRDKTVTRPTAVMPSTSVPVSSQRKCADHFWVRGLNKGTISPDSGSSATSRALLNSLHERQARQRLSSSVLPPAITGTIWSNVSAMPESTSDERQYAQRRLSNAWMDRLSSTGMYRGVIEQERRGHQETVARGRDFAAERRHGLFSGQTPVIRFAVGPARHALRPLTDWHADVPASHHTKRPCLGSCCFLQSATRHYPTTGTWQQALPEFQSANRLLLPVAKSGKVSHALHHLPKPAAFLPAAAIGDTENPK